MSWHFMHFRLYTSWVSYLIRFSLCSSHTRGWEPLGLDIKLWPFLQVFFEYLVSIVDSMGSGPIALSFPLWLYYSFNFVFITLLLYFSNDSLVRSFNDLVYFEIRVTIWVSPLLGFVIYHFGTQWCVLIMERAQSDSKKYRSTHVP